MMWSKTLETPPKGPYPGYPANHVFVFHNGTIIYKKHNPQSHGIIFDAFGSPWSPHHFDQDVERLTAPATEGTTPR
jgi:hypothetical protein